MKRHKHLIISAAAVLFAIFCVGVGYFALEQIYASGAGASAANHESYTGYLQHDLSIANLNLEILPPPPQTETTHTPAPELPPSPSHRYVVTSHNGYIVVHYAAHEGKSDPVKTVTNISTNALAPEELERLAQGIHIYTEEALFRILEDYGS